MMTADKIHDALSYIDDDMIEVVEKLREAEVREKKSFKQLYGFNMRVVVAAAVICLVVTAAFTIGPAVMIFDRYVTSDGSAGGAGGGNMAGNTVTGSENTSSLGNDGTDTDAGTNVILVRVTKIQTNGFAAKIVNDYGQGDIYDADDTRSEAGETGVLNVVYSDEIEFVEGIMPEAGSIVKIEYSRESGKIVAYRVMSEDYEEE